MSVDYQSLFNIAVIVIGALGGWAMGRITKAIDQLDRDVREMPTNYVSKVDYRNDLHDIKQLLQRIDQKMDGKADK